MFTVDYAYDDEMDVVAVISQVRLSGEADEVKEEALRDWTSRVGIELEEWMVTAAVGPRIYLDGEEEVEVIGDQEDGL